MIRSVRQPIEQSLNVNRKGDKMGQGGNSPRPLHEIAREIRNDWRPVNYAARPYLEAMGALNSIKDNYGYDSGTSVVAYFLSNASSWKGETARRIKKELKAKVGE